MKTRELNTVVKVDGKGNASVQLLNGEYKPISIQTRYRLWIGYRTWFGKTIFFNLLSVEHSFTLLIVLEAIYKVRKLPENFIEKALHTKEKPCTLIIGDRWRMRIERHSLL